MQAMSFDWAVFGTTLAALFLFGILYAMLVRWLSNHDVEGQTAYAVVGGVTVALLFSIPSFGLLVVAMLFAYFAACGLPMVVEYGDRVHKRRKARELEQQQDEEQARRIALDALAERQNDNVDEAATR